MEHKLLRLGWYRIEPDGTAAVRISAKPLSDDSAQEFREISKIATDLQPILFAFEGVLLAHSELKSSLQSITARTEKLFHPEFASKISAFTHESAVQLQLRLSTFLSACKTFIDHTGVRLQRLPGIGEPGKQAFETAASALYDTHFSYRFLSKLRNMSEHVMLPISAISLAVKSDGGSGAPRASVRLNAHREELLNGWTKWTTVRPEIERLDPVFDLMPYVDQHLLSMGRLCAVAFGFRLEEIGRCSEYMNILIRIANPPDDGVVGVWVGENVDENTPPEDLLSPPFEPVRRIVRVLNMVSAMNRSDSV